MGRKKKRMSMALWFCTIGRGDEMTQIGVGVFVFSVEGGCDLGIWIICLHGFKIDAHVFVNDAG